MSQLPRSTTVLLLGLTIVLALGGCDDSDSPTDPTRPLFVQSFQTATQPEAGGLRVQVRMRVTEGLDALRQASQTGAGRAQVCLSVSCDTAPISLGASEGMCSPGLPVEVDGTGMGLSVAWLEGDVVGVDFCVENVTDQRVFEIRLTDGMSSSNVVQTVCDPSGGLVFCGSG